MPNPFLSPELLNPSIQADVAAAYEKNVVAGRVIDEGFAQDLATGGLADKVRDAAEQAKQSGSEHLSGLEELPPDMRELVEKSFLQTEQLFARMELAAPSIEQFIQAGVDFGHLASEYERMEIAGLQPELVVTPVLPVVPTALTSGSWSELYESLTEDKTIPNNPLQARDDGKGLYINDDVQQIAGELYDSELNLVRSADVHSINEGGWGWTIALLPTTAKPQELSTPHTDKEVDALSSQHATISQYLTLQATRIQAGETPVDADTYTWLAGTFENGAQAPRGYWDSDDGQVYVGWDGSSYQYDGIGVRLPVWG